MKNLVIIILALVALVELAIFNGRPASNDYWFDRCVAAEDVIYRVYEDNDTYVLDVLSESFEWGEWITLAEKQEELG